MSRNIYESKQGTGLKILAPKQVLQRSPIALAQVDNAKHIDIVMSMHNLIEYSDNYSKTSGSLWQYCKDIPAVDDNNAIVNFTENNLTDSFNFKVKMTGQNGNDGTKNVEIILTIAYLSVFWQNLELPLINSEVNLIITWSANCVIVASIKMQHLQ